jgi:hypothetical protein
MTISRLLLLLIPAAAAVGCKSIKREFEPPLVVSNDLLELSVVKLQQKKDYLRVWMVLENLTDDTLVLDYGDFRLGVDGAVIPGALRVPFSRVDKEFEMEPHFLKVISGPVEFLGVGPVPEAEIVLTDIRREGETEGSELRIRVPVASGS